MLNNFVLCTPFGLQKQNMIFSATLVALHFTLVGQSVGHWTEFRFEACELVM